MEYYDPSICGGYQSIEFDHLQYGVLNSIKSDLIEPTTTEDKQEPVTVDITKFTHYMTIPDPGLTGSPSDIGRFNQPLDLAVDSKGKIYVSDYLNNRIQKFDPNGAPITTWGRTGSGPGQFQGVGGIFIDKNDIIYVGEYTGTRVQVFDENGKHLDTFPPENTDNNSYTLSHPYKVAKDSEGLIYITDKYSNRIIKLNSDGQFIKSWGGTGSGKGEFKDPIGIAIDSDDFIYVSDWQNHRLMKFDTDGNFKDVWGGQGHGDKQFAVPGGIAIDEHDNIYVAERDGHRISMLRPDGTWLGSYGAYNDSGKEPGTFIQPSRVAVHGDKVYTVEYGNSRVQVFTHPVENP